MIRLNIALVLGIAVWSTGTYAIPTGYTATQVVSDGSTLKLEARLISQSAKGYCAVVIIRNVGSESHQGWQVDFDIGKNTLKHLNNAKNVVSGSHVTVTPYPNDVNIEAGHQSKFEFCTEGASGPFAFQRSIMLSNHPPVATLTASYKVHDKNLDRGRNDKIDYCATVAIHNDGPDNIYDWRLTFDLGADTIVSMEHGKSDKTTGVITVTPTGGHKFIKSGHNRTIKFCASTRRVACGGLADETAQLSVSIISPQDGTTLEADKLVVSGTYSGPPNSGVAVNGVVAFTDGRYFYANDVPLLKGANSLEAIVTSPLGRTAKQTVKVQSTGNPPVLELRTSSRTSGIAPFTIAFRIGFVGSAAIRTIAIDFDGDGVVDFSGQDPSALIQYTYVNSGIYLAQAAATDAQGMTYNATRAVQVYDDKALDAVLNGIFNGMNNALLCGDIDRALSYVSVFSRDRYRPVYWQLKDQFPEIIRSYSPLQRSILAPSFAEYAINRTLDGAENIFFIYFVQDNDGVWRIDSM